MNQESNENPQVSFVGPPEQKPSYETPDSAGADIRAKIDSPLVIPPGGRVLVPTGLKIALPRGWEAQIRPRSGLAWKHGITVLNSPGTIDADYRGEIKIILVNLGTDDFQIHGGERIAQMVITRVWQAHFVEKEGLDESHRGEGGFGSTGRK